MISMKVQKKKSKQSGNPARSLILVTVSDSVALIPDKKPYTCSCTAGSWNE